MNKKENMKMKSKFLTIYNQIMEEISTYLEKDAKLTHGEKSSFGTSGSSFGTSGSSMYKISHDEGSDTQTSSGSTDNASAPPPNDVQSEDAGMTAMSVMGPSSPSQSLANTASAGSSLNVPHEEAGLTTADLKPIYCPAIPYGYKKRKKPMVIKRKSLSLK